MKSYYRISQNRLHYVYVVFSQYAPNNVYWMVHDDFGSLAVVDKLAHYGSLLSGSHH